jgi:hypothetical protein
MEDYPAASPNVILMIPFPGGYFLLILIILHWMGCMWWLFIIMHFMYKFNCEFLDKNKNFALRLTKDEKLCSFGLPKQQSD